MNDLKKIVRIMEIACEPTIDYCKDTGNPLGITGDMGEYLAGKKLDLKFSPARELGFNL